MRPELSFSAQTEGREAAIVDLFRETFSASEGAEEGALIGKLASDLIAKTPQNDLFVFTARADNAPVGAIIFSRLTYSEDDRSVFVLGPVAVTTDQQGKGVGQSLLRYGLEALRESGVDVALTYGDPNYYAKVGFSPISEEDAAGPYKLQYPEGWLGQSLDGTAYLPIRGTCHCVPAFQDPAYW